MRQPAPGGAQRHSLFLQQCCDEREDRRRPRQHPDRGLQFIIENLVVDIVEVPDDIGLDDDIEPALAPSFDAFDSAMHASVRAIRERTVFEHGFKDGG